MLGKADWYLIRSSGIVAVVLLTSVMVLGILTSGRHRLAGQPRFVTAAVHRSISLLAVVFVALHVVTTLLDPDAAVSALAVVLPFERAARAFWVGLGALSLDLAVALVATSLLRRRLGYRGWRVTHALAYLCWPLAVAHGVGMGTDAPSSWFRAVAAACLGSILVATAARIRRRDPGERLVLRVSE
jgi:methionine sulfoxide reductase heme-binding subunit